MKITAFNETKTVTEWCKDDRCMVKYSTLIARIKLYKWNPEDAITILNVNEKRRKNINEITKDKILQVINENKNNNVDKIAKILNISMPTLKKLFKIYDIDIHNLYKKTYIDISNKKFTFLTVLEKSTRKCKGGSYWKCKCICGKITLATSNQLRHGNRISCGCKNRGYNREINGCWYSNLRSGALNEGKKWEIDYNYICDLWEKQNGICVISGLKLIIPPKGQKGFRNGEKTASLDRKNSSIGYIPENVQWIHRDINWMKLDFDQEEFIEMCRIIAENNPRKL